MFNYNHLYYFYKTAKLKGVTTASRALRLSQPSLSIQLKTLEKSLGLQLFIKVGRRLQLTPDGERVYGLCKKIFEAADELDWYLKNSSDKDIQRCQIGVGREIDRPFVADVLSGLIKFGPDKDRPLLKMFSNDHSELVNGLITGEIDVVVTNHRVHAPNIRTLAELKMPVIAVVNSKIFKKINKEVLDTSIAKILKSGQFDLILPSESLKLRIETDLFLQKFKFDIPVVLESDILSVIVRAVVEGLGIGFLPRPYVFSELKERKIYPLNDNQVLWYSKLYVLTRISKNTNPIIEQIREHFQKTALR